MQDCERSIPVSQSRIELFDINPQEHTVNSLKSFIHAWGLSLIIPLFILFSASFTIAAENLSCSVNLDRDDNTGINITFDILDLDVVPSADGEHVIVSLSGESVGGLGGFPDLPHISRLVVIPAATGVELEWSASEPRRISSKPPRCILTESSSSEFTGNGADLTFQSEIPFLKNVVEIGKPAIMRGVRLLNVTVNPVQYNPAEGCLVVYDHVTVRLVYCPGEAENPAPDPDRNLQSEAAFNLIRSMVLNPARLLNWDADKKGTFVYVVPEFGNAGDAVANAIQPLVEWRLRQGYPTEVLLLEDDASNVDLKNMLVDAYFEWDIPPEVITLVGEADLVFADFMIPTWDVGRAYMWETDYKYVLLDGDDLLPDAAVGRISVRSLAELGDMVEKILRYETDPWLENPEWFLRAAVMANDDRTGYSSIYLQRWARKMMLEVGYAEVDTFYFIHGQGQQAGYDFLEDNFNRGISLFNYRGWGQFNGSWSIGDANRLNNENMLPFLILPTCNTCDFADHLLSPHSYAEDFLWADGGAIGVIGASGFTHTNYNNVLDGGILNGFLRDKNWRFGWALNQGKLELYRHFGLFNDVPDPQVRNLLTWEAHAYQFNLIGDAGTELWTGVPLQVEVEHPDTLTSGENFIFAEVYDAENNEPVSGVTMTVVRDGVILRNARTDENGEIEFVFDVGELQPGTYLFTASRHNMAPYLGEFEVQSANHFLGFSSLIIDDDQAGRSRGNDDNRANPGERLELRTFIKNFGNSPVEDAAAVSLELIEGAVDVVAGEVQVDQPPAANDSVAVAFVVDIGQTNWHNRSISMQLRTVTETEEWVSAFNIVVFAPDLVYDRHVFSPDPFSTGDTAWVDITIKNKGGLPNAQLSATLVSNREVVNVFNQHAEFDPVDPADEESEATARFRVHSHVLTVPGTSVAMTLLLEDESGFRDTTHFGFVVGSADDGTPFGPDAYGYVCFDDTDEAWDENRPVYEWVEIDPDLGGDGTDTEISDLGNEQDWSVLIDLPFDFKYYGREDIDQVTICSNGWFAFGDESKLADFHNRRIPPALGPRAQVCVFWDDLVNYVDDQDRRIGGVYHWFDAESHRFIIEWSRMRRYIGMQGGRMREGSVNTFQAIIYDPQHFQTYTGDGEIAFQYRTVNNDPDVDTDEFDTPYATVGIVNLNGTDGMEYTFWNEYPPGAAVLADERAIKFSTVLVTVVGFVDGDVTDIATGDAIEGAEIRGSRGSFGMTDADGKFFLDHVLIGEDYSFTAWAPGYNDSTVTGYDIIENDTISLSFALYHPEFSLSREQIEVAVRPGYASTQNMDLSNTGNGPLVFSTYFDYAADDDNALWTQLLGIDVSAETGDNRIQGVDFFHDRIWVTGSNNRDDPNRFYLFSRDGTYQDALDQPGESSYGFRGTTTDGNLLYGGDDENILGVNPLGELEANIPGPFDLQRALAWDPEGFMYVANGREDPLVKIDMDGNVVDHWIHELDIQGLGFLRDDPEGYPLYILSRDKTNPALQVPYALVTKMNPVTGNMRVVAVLEGELDDRAGGMEIVNGFNSTKWVMIAVMTNPNGDRVSVYDLGPNTDWVHFDPRSGMVPPRETIVVALELDAAGLEVGMYSLMLKYNHNAAGLQASLPIILHVDENAGVEGEVSQPLEFSLGQNFPNPFNSRTSIPFVLPSAAQLRIRIYDVMGRIVMTLKDDEFERGLHAVEFDAERFTSGIYILELKTPDKTARMKMMLIK